MITEEQRRALHALREALRLCEGAAVEVHPCQDNWVGVSPSTQVGFFLCSETDVLRASDIDRLLAEHPEP